MSEESILRYTDLAALIQMARARNWPTIRIVRAMSMGLACADALKLARMERKGMSDMAGKAAR